MNTLSAPLDGRRDLEIISLIGFVHGVSHFFHLLLPPLFPWLMAEFGLSFAAIGVTMTVFFVVSGVGQAMAGFLVDRFGAARVLAGGISCFVLAGLTTSTSATWPGVTASAALVLRSATWRYKSARASRASIVWRRASSSARRPPCWSAGSTCWPRARP